MKCIDEALKESKLHNLRCQDEDKEEDSAKHGPISRNDMARYVFNHCQLSELQDDPKVYPSPYIDATTDNCLSYVSKIANVKGAKSLRPRNKAVPAHIDWKTVSNRFGFVSEKIMKETWKITTQLGCTDVRYPMRRHYKSRIAGANVNRLNETYSTDTMFASVPAITGETCVQLFTGNQSTITVGYGMKREGEGLAALEQFVTEWGAPSGIRRDNSKMQNSEQWRAFEQKMQIKQELSKPHNQQQNPAER